MSISATPWTVASNFLFPWNSPAKNTGMGSHSLLQGIFPNQGSNPGPLHCRILYRLSHEGSLLLLLLLLSHFSHVQLRLCDPMDCSLPGSSIHGIFQARVLEWGAIAFSNNVILFSFKTLFMLHHGGTLRTLC